MRGVGGAGAVGPCQAPDPHLETRPALAPADGKDLRPDPTAPKPVPPGAGERMNLLREPDAGNPPVPFDERDVETDHGGDTGTPAIEGAAQRWNAWNPWKMPLENPRKCELRTIPFPDAAGSAGTDPGLVWRGDWFTMGGVARMLH